MPRWPPLVLVIPPKVIHTSRNINGAGWLIDIFSPPRLDFRPRQARAGVQRGGVPAASGGGPVGVCERGGSISPPGATR